MHLKMTEGKDMTTHTTTEQAEAEVFLGKVLSDTSGLTTTIMASIGDRLGLFRPWGQYIRTVTHGKLPGGTVAKKKSKGSQCANRRDTLKPSSASCVQNSRIVWSVKASCNGVSRFQIA
jgi:hypothetical protein